MVPTPGSPPAGPHASHPTLKKGRGCKMPAAHRDAVPGGCLCPLCSAQRVPGCIGSMCDWSQALCPCPHTASLPWLHQAPMSQASNHTPGKKPRGVWRPGERREVENLPRVWQSQQAGRAAGSIPPCAGSSCAMLCSGMPNQAEPDCAMLCHAKLG